MGNEYYDYFIVAGNSDEAVETYSGDIGGKDYKQRTKMLQGAKILHDKIQGKAGRMILWAPHAYQFGYLRSMALKPWRQGVSGELYNKDGKNYMLTMTTETMAKQMRNGICKWQKSWARIQKYSQYAWDIGALESNVDCL